MQKTLITIVSLFTLSLFLSASSVFADDKEDNFWNYDNCIDSKWKDADGNKLSFDDKFGAGTAAVTRCLAKTKRAKILYQINTLCKTSKCDAPYAIGNISNHIADMQITHGMDPDDYDIVVIVHSAGWKQVLNNNAVEKHAEDNPFQAAMENLVNTPSVKVLFCMNTANSKGITLPNMIEGIGFVTAGVSAISDLQTRGYKYIQP